MNKKYEEQIEHDKSIVKFSKYCGINDNITCRKYDYPDKFYQVLEALDLVMRVWNGEPMGTSGVEELGKLFVILKTDFHLLSCMPKEAYVFFKIILNPKNDWKICNEACMGFGYIHRAYSELRTYLIDNKERITEVYNRWYELSSTLSEEMEDKYKIGE